MNYSAGDLKLIGPAPDNIWVVRTPIANLVIVDTKQLRDLHDMLGRAIKDLDDE